MSNLEDADLVTRITFRADDVLDAALRRASKLERMSISDVVRQSVLRTLRAAGLLEEKP
jgi:hypothetical protein